MNLTLIAEVLAGETIVTPGGCVDHLTACGGEPFLWQSWMEEVVAADAGVLDGVFDVTGVEAEAAPVR